MDEWRYGWKLHGCMDEWPASPTFTLFHLVNRQAGCMDVWVEVAWLHGCMVA